MRIDLKKNIFVYFNAISYMCVWYFKSYTSNIFILFGSSMLKIPDLFYSRAITYIGIDLSSRSARLIYIECVPTSIYSFRSSHSPDKSVIVSKISFSRFAFISYTLRFPRMSREESITRKVSQLTNQIRRDIKKTNDPSEMEADKCVFFFSWLSNPLLPPLSLSLAACSRLTSMNRGSDNRRNGSSVRSEGPVRRGGGRRGAGERGEGSAKRRETGPEDRRGEGEGGWVWKLFSVDARTGRTLVKMAHGIN